MASCSPSSAGSAALLWFHGPDWAAFREAFTVVEWDWVAIAIGFNLLSVVARAFAWQTVINAAIPPPHPGFRLVFSAFSVGLLANAVLPGRVGELARVAVLNRKIEKKQPGLWSTLVGTVFVHRVFDLVPVLLITIWVLFAAKIPDWAYTSLVDSARGRRSAVPVRIRVSARQHGQTRLDGMGSVRRIVTMARYGLGVMRKPIRGARRDSRPVLRLDVPDLRGVDGDEGVRHPRWACRLPDSS